MSETYLMLQVHFPWFLQGVAFVFGAIVGSFLNVCIYRIPLDRSIVSPGSRCACGAPVAWYDNIPVFSWLVLRGRARCCGRRFSVRYPAVELLTALLFLLCWMRFSPASAAVAVIGMGLSAILICSTFIDFDHMIIPDRFSIGGAVVGVFVSLLVPALHGQAHGVPIIDNARSGLDAVLGALVGSGVVLWIMYLGEIVFRKEAMGGGDVKLMGAIGAFCGWQGALFAIFGGAVLGCLGFAVVKLAQPLAAALRRRAEEDGEPRPERVRDEGDGGTLYLDLTYLRRPEDPPSLEANVSPEQPFWTPETMALRAESQGPEEPAGAAGNRVRERVRLRAQTVEDAGTEHGRIPFGPMLAAGGLIYFLGFEKVVDNYFKEVADVLLAR